MRPAGKIQREHQNYFVDLMKQIEWDLHQEMLNEGRVPDAWHEIARSKMRQGKTRITLRLEDDVVKFFRKMGPRYQQRMNDVLSAWMHGRLAGLIKGPDASDVDLELMRVEWRTRLGDGELSARNLVRGKAGRIFDVEGMRYLEEGEG
ncbi:uncharacterized protein (DUF4415 family) [Sulfitobacter undariae]|uniref:Uncharacterized protein (DUF4415 family) n=1 Tax=Sulfitobacter undariae TaxID=1563671 RepID=A0A7W6E235_9RHOB|nr:BrnA antitoxin family protein [Sulfitobacter undariae]MBB3993293.1 uncharacterized protein (DUF4415 family) [Sulfitobacter undariae]